MADLDYAHLSNTAGNTSGNWATDIGNAATSYACHLYSTNRDWFVQQSGLLSAPTGFIDGLMSNACAGRPGYAAPVIVPNPLAFTGGQCPVLYNIDVGSHSSEEGDGHVPNAPLQYYGPISFSPYGDQSQAYNASGVNITARRNSATSPPFTQGVYQKYYPSQTFKIYSISRVDGQEDNCGNAPQPAPPLPSINALNTLVNVGGIPTSAVFKGLNKDGSVNVAIGNVPVKLGYNGADVGTPTVSLGVSANGTTPGAPPNYTEEPANASSDGQSGKDSNVASLKYVVIDITSIPINAHIKYGHGEPDIIYAGWIEFQRGGYSFPRENIDFTKGVFIAPDGADGYAYTLDIGYSGTASAIVATPAA